MKINPSIPAALLCALLLTSCAKDEGTAPGGEGSATVPGDVPIVPAASVSVGAEAVSKALSGPVEGTSFPASTEGVFFVTAVSGAAEPSAIPDTPYFSKAQVDSKTAGTYVFNPMKYYPVDASTRLYFYAYSPQENVSGATSSTAKWTIDGQQDIMYANVTSGYSKETPGNPGFAFEHKLMQVGFTLKAGTGMDPGVKVTSLKVPGQNVDVTLDVISGTVSFTGNGTLTLPPSGKTDITAGGTQLEKRLMFRPGDFSLEVETSDGVTYTKQVKITNAREGDAYNIILTFNRTEMSATASIAEWTDGGTVGAATPDAYPYVVNGNTIVVKDMFGQADPAKYPIHEEKRTTTEWFFESAWNSNNSGHNTAAGKFMVSSRQLFNTPEEALQAASNYNTPAGTKGTWRIATMREVELIYQLGLNNSPWSYSAGRKEINGLIYIWTRFSNGSCGPGEIQYGYYHFVRDL